MTKLRFGIISEVFPAKGTARVSFPADKIVSGELPILTPRSKNDKQADTFDINEQVVCLMDEHSEDGVILGAIFSSVDQPEGAGVDIWVRKFQGGTMIKHDRSNNKLTINLSASGSLEITGDLKVIGKIEASDNIESTSGDVKAASISLKLHTHPGVQPGSGSTGTPV